MRERYPGRGLSRATIQNYESGRTQPKAPDLAVLADLFGVSADYLLGLTDDPTPPPPSAAYVSEQAARVAQQGP